MLMNVIPNTIMNAVGVTTSQVSVPIRPRKGSFALDIRANGGSGTQTLNGVFKLQAKNDERASFIDVTDYSFTSGPTGSAWNFFGTFDGMWGTVYQLAFTASSGQGDITATINFPE